MKYYPQVATRVLNTPLLLEPAYARVFFSALASRLGIGSITDAEGVVTASNDLKAVAAGFNRSRDVDRPFEVVNGVAVLPVSGSLVHKSSHVQPFSGTTGYNGILHRAASAFADPAVKGVLMDNQTPGGEVSGCFDTARTLRKMADAAGKPLWAIAFDMNCSGGMALASAAHRRLITRTGHAGSVGVVMAHGNYEQHLQEAGVDVTLIHSGARKVDGNPYGALPAEVLERFQAETDALRTEFAQLISDHTGLALNAVLATEAATFRGQAAVDVGFADELVNGNEAIAIFSEHLSSQGRTTTIGATMAEETLPDSQATQPGPTPAAAVPDAAASKTAERTRIANILGHANAEGRGKLANHLALNTDLSAEDAVAVLAQAEAERDSANMETALDSMMAGQDTEIGADASDGASAETDMVSQVVNAYRAATGATA